MSSLGKVTIGRRAPDFHCEAVIAGKIREVDLSYFIDDSSARWLILLFIPAAFSFVCPTEVLAFQNCLDEFSCRDCSIAFVSVDSKHSLWHWQNVPKQYGGLGKVEVPLLSDSCRTMSRDYGVLIGEDGVCLRGMFIIDNEGIVQQVTLNNLTVGRSVLEALRLLEAFQAVQKHGVMCPIDWRPSSYAKETLDTISKTLTDNYDERLANLQAEFGNVQVVDLDAQHAGKAKSASSSVRGILTDGDGTKDLQLLSLGTSNTRHGSLSNHSDSYTSTTETPRSHATSHPRPQSNNNRCNANWESRRGSHVNLEFADPTTCPSGHMPTTPAPSSARSSERSSSDRGRPQSTRSKSSVRSSSPPNNRLRKSATAPGELENLNLPPHPQQMQFFNSQCHSPLPCTPPTASPVSQTRFQATVQAIRKMGSGLGSPRWENLRVEGAVSAGAGGRQSERRGYFDVVPEALESMS